MLAWPLTLFLRAVLALLAGSAFLAAATTGSISGTVKDPSDAIVAGSELVLTDVSTGVPKRTTSDDRGLYSFPSLAVGRYDLKAEAPGFRPLDRKGIVVDANSALKLDLTFALAEHGDALTVSEARAEIRTESVSTQMGEVVTGSRMMAVALNGRSFTDLLALQPGVVPVSTQQPDSVVMAGASVAIPPSGGLNPGNQSIAGQREDANGFLVNDGDVKELMNGGASVIPNLDSIAEFRILTNNFDAEFGNYSGGIVNIVTKSGGNDVHGTAFEFLRNTALDARNFFSPERSFYRQNQFGATVGGPVRRNRVFYFSDYQGTRTSQGIDTGLIAVPSVSDRTGNLSDIAGQFTGSVGGPYLANLLTQSLGYGVTSSEPYYTRGCVSNTQCVFPNAAIPMRAWSEPATHLLSYIPLPNVGASTFSTGAEGQTVRDDKGSVRIDGNAGRWGNLSGYYFFDDYSVDNPYPTGQGGANVPGFNALNLGRAQLINFGDTATFGATAANEFRLSFMRNSNNVGQPVGGVGPTLASQGFVTGVGTPGIAPLAPEIEGIENTIFNSFVIGTPITNLKQANNTYRASDSFSRVFGAHSMKAGVQLSFEQVNVNPNPTFNGSFLFSGSETGSDFADFLIGVASNYNQADSQTYYARHKYAGGFAQDSWRIGARLTVNYGVRWDLMEYWYEKYNQIPALVPGAQSAVFPDAPPGILYPGDKGIPRTLVPASSRFSPRIGIAWGGDKTSIRAGYGIFYSVIQGNTLAFDEPQPPYGLSYTSLGPPLFATPFITASNGAFNGNPFPLTFPPLNASPSNPVRGIDFSIFEPIAGATGPNPGNTYPYNENYFLSVERKFTPNSLLSVSYVGSQAHHLILVYSANPGNPALCLALSRPSAVAPGSPTCGPFGEDTTYITASGQTIQGTRSPLGSAFSNNDYEGSIGNSSYHSLQASLRYSGRRVNASVGYTYSKSIDQASSLADPVNPFNFKATRALSSFDLRHSFVASYECRLPFGLELSGITRASTGFPVTLSTTGDFSLMGSIPNGVNNHSLDLPDYNGGPLGLNGDPRNGLEYFNAAAFSDNALGTAGNASRRSFYGPGSLNFDLALLKTFRLLETRTAQLRLETLNTFNHAQFLGAASVNGTVDSPLFGQVVKAASPRLVQIAVKIGF
jgi:hypothetical protein